jgi:dienelactone hydrolase
MEARPEAVRIPAGPVELDADLVPPKTGRGVVLFAHGSGSGRKSPRNREVAERLHTRGFGTLLLDLLARAEVPVDEVTGEYRFNIELLTERLLAATDWLVDRPGGKRWSLGYFGASTGGAVAMAGAAQRARVVKAIVLRGARTDLGDRWAAKVRCPTLVLVGGDDPQVLELNQRSLELLQCEKQLVVVPGASHLFEEPGALDRVAALTVEWFDRHLRSTGP